MSAGRNTFTIQFCTNKTYGPTGRRPSDRTDLTMETQRFIVHEDKMDSHNEYYDGLHTAISSAPRSFIRFLLHCLVSEGARYQAVHRDQLTQLTHMQSALQKEQQKVVLCAGNKERLLHLDVENLLSDSLTIDHRAFVREQIAKLSMFDVPTHASSQRHIVMQLANKKLKAAKTAAVKVSKQ